MKVEINKFRIFLLLLTIIGLGSGCNGNQNELGDNNKDLSNSQVHTSEPVNQSVANQAKEKVIRKEEISGVKAVNTDKELVLAIKVDNFNRFQLKKIEKNIKTDLEKMYPDYKVIVSADSKIYLEVEKLEQKLQKDKVQMETLKKELDKIKSLMKEQT